MSKSSTRDFAAAQDDLRAALPGYETRPQQQTLAVNIEQALRDGGHLLAEAGTGTGKSLGYLIPAIQSGKRVVVSTATKALQDQIAGKDLPFLAEHLQEDFTYAILKGRSNYACQAKVVDPDVVASNPSQTFVAETISVRRSEPGFMGERDDFPTMPDKDWRGFTTTSENCPGKRQCPFGDVCFAEKAKDRAKESDIVVVNHALFLTDIKVRVESDGYGTMLGPYDAVVFDEAHEIEQYASNIFGNQFSEAGVTNVSTEVVNWVRRHIPGEEVNEAAAHRANLGMAMADLWRVLKPGRITQAVLVDSADQFVEMTNALTTLSEYFSPALWGQVPADLREGSAKAKFDILRSRVGGLANRFREVVLGDMAEVVRWVEEEKDNSVGGRGQTRRNIKMAPIRVDHILRDALFDVKNAERADEKNDMGQPTAILTSATLSVGKRFDYIASRLGIDAYGSIDVGTPFDYQEQARIYVPRHMASPKDRAAWQSMAVAEMRDLINASQGRALLLFTSYSAMKDAYNMLAPRLPYRVMMQGQMPNKALAKEFNDDITSVLFATRSFMTGVDIQGESLSLVVIDKLPFPVPTDPIIESKSEAIERDGGNAFSGFVVPEMTLVLKQAFGRLVRHRNDKGVVAILDSRLLTTGYGRGIINSLPDAPLIERLDDVREFFDNIEYAAREAVGVGAED